MRLRTVARLDHVVRKFSGGRVSGAEAAISQIRPRSSDQSELDSGAGYASMTEKLRFQSLNSHLGRLEPFSGLAQPAGVLGLKDSQDRAMANAARAYRRAVELL